MSLCEHGNLPTGGAALVDDDAQSVTHSESQVWTFIDGHTEYAGHAFEGSQQVHGTGAEAREHGPNLKEEYTHELLINSFTKNVATTNRLQ